MAGRNAAPAPDRIVAAALPGRATTAANRPRLHELVEQLLAESISLDEFVLGAPAAGLDRVEAARLAAACAALPTPGAATLAAVSAQPRSGGTLRVGLWIGPEGLDAALATTRTSRLLTEQLYSTLTSLDADGRPYPDLAEWIEISDGGKTYTFGLRPGVRFHDGTELTATDVAFSLDRLLSLGEEYHFEPWTVTMAGTEVVDRSTVRLRLNQVTGPILTWLAFCGSGIVPAAAVRSGHDLDRHPIGSGPFRLAEGGLGPDGLRGPIRFVRNGAAGTGGPNLDGLEFVTMLDDAERAQALIRGEIDLDAFVGPSVWPTLTGAHGLGTSMVGDGRWHWLMVNCTDPLLADVRVRQAISQALDRQALVDDGLFGLGSPIRGGVVAPWSWAADPALAGFGQRADLDRARALLAEAGVAPGSRLSVAATAGTPIGIRQAELVAAQLSRAGLDARLEILDTAAWAESVRRDGSFQLATSYWGSPINDPDDFVYMAYRSGARFDVGTCGTPLLDELLDAGRASIHQADRAEHYRHLQALTVDELPLIPTVQPPVLRAHTTRLRNFVPLRNAQLKTLRHAWLED